MRENKRREAWVPPRRPDWVQRINEEGAYMDVSGIVPLDENSLLATARANTGLSDFGEDDWYEPFQVLIKSLEEEAQLNLMGRLLTRSDLLLYLQARLQVEDTYRRHPAIEDEQVVAPLMILGQGRSGTSALLNMLAEDPDNGVVRTWEAMFPCPPPEKASYRTDPRIERADRLITQWNRVTPEVPSVHEFNGMVPTESIHVFCLGFRSTGWLNIMGQIPSYNVYMNAQSMVPALHYEKRVMKLLQWKNPRKHWVLKNPDSARYIPETLEVYPDMHFAWIHRDPVRALASMINLIGILGWIRSDQPHKRGSFDAVTDPELMATQLCVPIDLIAQGVIPPERLCNVQYQDFMEDPFAVAKRIYEYVGRPMTEQAEASMRRYMAENPRTARPRPKIDIGSHELVEAERRAFRRYQEYFGVPNEI
jgi:Sulfotransferase family